jgi:hypothetical protein
MRLTEPPAGITGYFSSATNVMAARDVSKTMNAMNGW